MVVATERGRDAVSIRPHDTEKRGFSMLNHTTLFGDPRLPARYWDKVRPQSNGCWLWMSHLNWKGYPEFWFDGRSRMAHRFAFQRLVGSVMDGLTLDHTCDTPACVNIEHLRPATHRDNILRGSCPPALNAVKTHCPQGHPYDEVNTYFGHKGWRMCRACRRAHDRRRKQQLRRSR